MADKTELTRKLLAGVNCAQAVLAAFGERFDYSEEELYRFGAAFGGGMQRGDTCGAVTGALMAIGLEYADDNALLHEKVARFHSEFAARCGSTYCRELLGYDFSVPGEHARCAESGLMAERCPGYVFEAVQILEEMLEQ